MKLWTIQRKTVLDTIMNTGIWVPDFEKSKYRDEIPGFKENYDFILDCFNKVNRCNSKGLVFCFMKRRNDEVFTINSISDFESFLNNNYKDLSKMIDYINTEESVLLELDVDTSLFYPMLIELNDWNLMAVGYELFPYPEGYISDLKRQLSQGKLSLTRVMPTNVVQAHIPYIKSEDIVNAYDFQLTTAE